MTLEEEETVFWMLAQIAQVVVPEYYAPALEGVQADGEVLQGLAERWVPHRMRALITAAGVPMALVASRWLLPLCAQSLPPLTLHRLWDLAFLRRDATPLLAAALTVWDNA